MLHIPINPHKKRRPAPKSVCPQDDSFLHLAFDNSVQPNIMTIAGSGRIIIVNRSACRFLGYSARELLTKTSNDIFDVNDCFTKLVNERTSLGYSTGIINTIKKNGALVPCEITSAMYNDGKGIEKAIYILQVTNFAS